MSNVKSIKLPKKLAKVFNGDARFRYAFGGRGSGKSRGFALMMLIKAMELSQAGHTGTMLCLRQNLNTLADSSMSELKNVLKETPWLNEYFESGEKFLRTKDRRIEFLFYGLTRNLDSLKSLARIHVAWVDEAATVTEEAWRKLIPSVREEGSEIWVTWNPEFKRAATDKRFRFNTPDNALGAELNYMDNPWFPDVLEQARLDDKEKRPETYSHVWLGDYLTVVQGSYYEAYISEAKEDARITDVEVDPLMSFHAYWDIGGTGAKADATAIVICQLIGKRINVVDYYEAQGQPLSTHVAWLRKKKYDNAVHYLPHDGKTNDKVYDVSFESSLQEIGFDVIVVPNQGKGAAMKRIDETRRIFGKFWFDKRRTDGLIEALRYYHSKVDEARGIDLGPNHDWASHGSDAFGMIAVTYEEPTTNYDLDFEVQEQWVV